jgi:lysophospholipase
MSLTSSDSLPRPAGPASVARFLRDAEWANATRLRNYLALLAFGHVAALVAFVLLARSGVDPRGEPLGSDFVSFWAAGRMALGGHAAAVYDPASHLAAERAFFGSPIGWYAFFYPPVFLLACLPLGLLSYMTALAVWLAASFAAFTASLRALSKRFINPLTIAAFPGVFATIGHGQNAFLTTALFAAGASLLESRPALAGALFGLLSFKPQLAVVAPLALLAAGRFRAVTAMATTVAAMAALSYLAFGASTWAAFLAETPMTRATLERGLVDPDKMQSVFAAVRVLGGGVRLAYAAQCAAALAALAALVLALRRERDARRQFALAAVITCLTTPFLLDYDLTLLIVPIAALADEGLASGFLPYEITTLVAAYLLPGFARPLAHYAHLPASPLVVAWGPGRFAAAAALRHKPGAPLTARGPRCMALYAADDDPIPPGAIEHELTALDGVRLRAARWTPENPRGTVVLLGGRSEFIEKYYETIRDLLGRGLAVATMDWRGQGGSERQLRDPAKGHIDDFSLYERDFLTLHRDVLSPHCPRPWIGLCHSMGGAIMLRIAHAGRCPFDRLVLTAPMIALYRHPEPRRLRWLVEALDGAGLGGFYAPGGGGPRPYARAPFAGNMLTSDPQRYGRMAEMLGQHPELAVGGPTIGWLHAALRLMRAFAEPDFPRAIATPTLVIASGADRVIDTRAVERFATRLSAGHLIVIDGARHEAMMERDAFRELFFKAFDAFALGAEGAFTPPLLAAT